VGEDIYLFFFFYEWGKILSIVKAYSYLILSENKHGILINAKKKKKKKSHYPKNNENLSTIKYS
jgi:hypothetical protein